MKNIKKKKIFSIFSIILVSFCVLSLILSNVFAEINPDVNKFAKQAADGFNDVFTNLGEIAASSAFSGIASIITALAGLMYLLLGLMFSGSTGSIFPSVDNIIFNRIAILDINFFNPNRSSVFAKAGGDAGTNVVAQLYNTFQTIAISVFIIAAMIVGIKLALSSIAQEKAQCKKAITNWLVGIIILFLMRLILAGMFELNELLVWNLSTICDGSGMVFECNFVETIPIVGAKWADIIGSISQAFLGKNILNDIEPIYFYGFNGFVSMSALKAFGGDILSAVLLFVLIGQTITLLVSYGKRLIYTIILGAIAPLIVAVDTIGKATKGQSTVLSNWFKEIVLIIFNQTFHSVLLVVTLKLLSQLSKAADTGSSLFGLVSIILISGIMKFEKLYKQLFGVQDSMMGNLQGQAGKLMAGLHGAGQAAKALGDNKKKADAAKKNISVAQQRKAKLEGEKTTMINSHGQNSMNSINNTINAAAVAKDPNERENRYRAALGQINELEKSGFEDPALGKMKSFINSQLMGGGTASGNVVQANGTSTDTSKVTPRKVSGGGKSSPRVSTNAAMEAQALGNFGGAFGDVNAENVNMNSSNVTGKVEAADNSQNDAVVKGLQDIRDAIKESAERGKNESFARSIENKDAEIKNADADIEKAKREYKSAKFAQAMGPANLAAGIGFGIGTGQDLSESLLKGGYFTSGMDALSEKVGTRVGANVSAAVSEGMKPTISMIKTGKNVRSALKRSDSINDVGSIY